MASFNRKYYLRDSISKHSHAGGRASSLRIGGGAQTFSRHLVVSSAVTCERLRHLYSIVQRTEHENMWEVLCGPPSTEHCPVGCIYRGGIVAISPPLNTQPRPSIASFISKGLLYPSVRFLGSKTWLCTVMSHGFSRPSLYNVSHNVR